MVDGKGIYVGNVDGIGLCVGDRVGAYIADRIVICIADRIAHILQLHHHYIIETKAINMYWWCI